MKTYIVGHKNPDTDSVVSALALAALEKAQGEDFEAAVAGELNKETIYVLRRFGFETPSVIVPGEKRVLLVDHNEPSQIHENINTKEVVGIFDHHKLGGLSTQSPISVTMRPVGSTSTIIFGSFEKNNVELGQGVAGLLLAGVLSDTLNLTSPTTTERDKEVAKLLSQSANADSTELASEMFKAKSDISDISTEELIGKDYKVFDLCGKKVGIGVWETVLPQTILDRKDEIIEFLSKKKIDEVLDYVFFATVDIVNEKSDFFILGDEEKALAEATFGGVTEANVLVCPGIVSRKKQIVPPLEAQLEK